MSFLPSEIEDYIIAHSSDEPDLLAELNRETHVKILRPEMLSGHYQGRLLSILSKMLNPKVILEIGTYTGYSAICLAEGLTADGELHTIDINEELEPIQNRYFKRSGHQHKIHRHVGDAQQIIPEIKKSFDLVFLDADKEHYVEYFRLVSERINPGGLLIADNVLWYGKVIEPAEENDQATKSLIEFNALLKKDKTFETLMLPVRDGLTIARKL